MIDLQQESQQLAMLPMDEKYDRKDTREGREIQFGSVVGRGDLVKTGSPSCFPTWRHFQIGLTAVVRASFPLLSTLTKFVPSRHSDPICCFLPLAEMHRFTVLQFRIYRHGYV